MYYLKLLSPDGQQLQAATADISSARCFFNDAWPEYSDGKRLMCLFGREDGRGILWLPFWTEIHNIFRLGQFDFARKIQSAWDELDALVELSRLNADDNANKLPK